MSPFVPFICLPFSPSLDAWHGSLGERVHLSPVVSLDCSHCLPVWMPGTALWVDGFICLPSLFPFICLPLSSSLDVWRDSLGGRVHLSSTPLFPFISLLLSDFDFAWARGGGSSSLSIVGYTLSVRSVPRYQLRSRADDSGALRCAASATRRLY